MVDRTSKLRADQHIHNFHQGVLRFIDTMVMTGKEPVGAMGNDTAPAVFSDLRRALTDFKKQRFAMITNPSIHPYTESDIMSLKKSLGSFKGIDGNKTNKNILDSAIITKKTLDKLDEYYDIVPIDCTFDYPGTFETFQTRKEEIKKQALDIAKQDKQSLLTNEHAGEGRAPFELDMIGPAVHLHLLNEGVRGQTALHGRPMEASSPHDIACLFGSGFDTVNPHLVEHTIAQRHYDGMYGDMSFDQCFENYFQGSDFGLVTVMAKMGICSLESYRGAFQFEALGFGPKYIEEFAPGVHSEIGGFELEDFYKRAVRFHQEALDSIAAEKRLPDRGIHRISQSPDAEDHANVGPHIAKLQEATKTDDFNLFLEYAEEKRAYNKEHPTQIRDLWDIEYIKDPSEVTEEDLEGVQSVEEICSTLGAASMSYGSTSPEQFEDIALGTKMAGAQWKSGEGGVPDKLKEEEWPYKGVQIASGRFIDVKVPRSCR